MATIVESITTVNGLVTAGQSATVGTGLDLTGHVLSCTVSPGVSYTDEQARDAVGAILTDTATIDFTYTDAGTAGGTISADVKADSITVAMMHSSATARLFGRSTASAGAGEEISIGTGLSLAAGVLSCTVAGYTDEMAQDTIGSILTDTATIDFTYSDLGAGTSGTITADVKTNSITDALIRQGGACTVIGRSANSGGNVADIAIGADGKFLVRRSGAITADVLLAADIPAHVHSGADITTGTVAALRLPSLDGLTPPVGDVSLNTHRIINLVDPASAQDAATKAYVDALANGNDWKASVRCATTAALPAHAGISGNTMTATVNGAFAAVDGVTLALNERILVKDEATQSQNGIWQLDIVGTAGTKWRLIRTEDANADAEVTAGMSVWVAEGTVNGDTAWVLTANDPITLNTTNLTFTQFGGVGSYTGTGGVVVTGTVISVTYGTGANTVCQGNDTRFTRAAYTDVANVFTLAQTIFVTDAGTADTVYPVLVKRDSSGAPAAGFGAGVKIQLESSTTSGRDAGSVDATWTVSTDATRKSRVTVNAYDAVGAKEGFRVESNGSAAAIGFFGNAAAIQQSGSIITALGAAGYGLISSPTIQLTDISSVTTGKLIGRTTAGTGSPELLTVSSALTLSAGTLTVAANGVTDAMLRQSAGLSVIGRSANTSGNVTDITGTDGQVLRVSGTALGFGSVAAAAMPALTGDVTTVAGAVATTIGANKVLDTMIRQSAGLSVVGRSANTTGNVADITGTDGKVLRVNGTTLGFGDYRPPTTAKSADFTAGTAEETYPTDVSGGSKTATLPAASGNTGLKLHFFLSVAPGANTLTLDANSTETINGALTLKLYYQHDWVSIFCDGTNWRVMNDTRARPLASVKLVADMLVNNSTVTAILWDAEDYDTLAMHDTVTNKERITVKRPGKYLVQAFVDFEGATTAGADTGLRQIIFYKTGVADISQTVSAATVAGEDVVTLDFVYDLAAGDYMEVRAWQNSGSNRKVMAYLSHFSLTFLGD